MKKTRMRAFFICFLGVLGMMCWMFACLLHLLIHMWAIDDIRQDHTVAVDANVGILVESTGIGVPDLQNVEALLGTDADAYNRILFLRGCEGEDGGRHIADEGLVGGFFRDFDTVGTAANVGTIFPERWKGVLHEEEHTR